MGSDGGGGAGVVAAVEATAVVGAVVATVFGAAELFADAVSVDGDVAFVAGDPGGVDEDVTTVVATFTAVVVERPTDVDVAADDVASVTGDVVEFRTATALSTSTATTSREPDPHALSPATTMSHCHFTWCRLRRSLGEPPQLRLDIWANPPHSAVNRV